jgi:tripartite-type tricarboxylate transporter receptor subunit TctC
MIERRTLLKAVAAVVVGRVISGAHAQSYPSKNISIVVPWAAGGNTDVTSRLIATKLAGMLGKPVIVENKPGAGGNIGVAQVTKSAPDGHTLLAMVPANAVNGTFYSNLPFDLARDLTPIGVMATTPLALVVPTSSPARSVAELIEQARQRPGSLNYGIVGLGSMSHLTAELFQIRTNTNLTRIPYKGGSAALTDLMGGQIQVYFDTFSTTVPLVKAGRIRILALCETKRSDLLPDVPTFAELGYKGMEVLMWVGLVAPAGTDPAIVKTLNTALNRILGEQEVKQRLAEMGAAPQPGTPEQFEALIRGDIAKWGEVIRTANIKLE